MLRALQTLPHLNHDTEEIALIKKLSQGFCPSLGFKETKGHVESYLFPSYP